jgi:RNA polymerase sigma-70 factor (ECF subfamily)
MGSADDQELMLSVKDGDVAAFETLYARYSRPLVNFFYRLVWDRQRAEDLMQETFLRLWRGRSGYVPSGKFTTYLFQIGKNHWLNERDKTSRRIAPVSLDAGGAEGSNGLAEAVPARGGGPVRESLDHELGELIAQAVSTLSEKLKLVFVLGQVQGIRYAEISEILGIPVGTVKSRMANAEKTIRGRLSGYLDMGAGGR